MENSVAVYLSQLVKSTGQIEIVHAMNLLVHLEEIFGFFRPDVASNSDHYPSLV